MPVLALAGILAALLLYLAAGMLLIDLYERWLDWQIRRRYNLPPSSRPKRAIRLPGRCTTSPRPTS